MAKDPPPSEFETLVGPLVQGLFRFVFWWIGQREDAEDALQDVLIRAHRGFGKLREKEKFKSWIYKIAANVARTKAKQRRRTPRSLGATAVDESKIVLMGRGEPTPFAEIQAADADARLAKALESLAPELREPLLLHTLSGMKYREVAETLGLPLGTVTAQIHTARERLAGLLGDK